MQITAPLEMTTGNGKAGKIVVITGVTRGLGRALAVELAARGHFIVGCGRSDEKLTSLRRELGEADGSSKHLFMVVDVASDASVRDFAKAVMIRKGNPDIIVNNAGIINELGNIWDLPSTKFDAVIDVNLKGAMNVTRHFVPLLIPKKHGALINITSGWGRIGAAKVAPYCASKWAIEGLTQSVAKEVPQGIVVVALNPGIVNTDMIASCFGPYYALYPSPNTWATHAAEIILNLKNSDNGASLNV